MLVASAYEKALICIPCIHNSVWFQKNKGIILALIDFSSKVNTMLLTYTKKLGLQIQKTDISAQKIDRSTLSILEMVITSFQV